jgi:hypothetical protein
MANHMQMMATRSPIRTFERGLEERQSSDEPEYEIAADQEYEIVSNQVQTTQQTIPNNTRNTTDNERGVTNESLTSSPDPQPSYLALLNDNVKNGQPSTGQTQNTDHLYQSLSTMKNSSKPKESVGRKPCSRETCLMFVILLVSLLALLLVILDIAGAVGPSCSCQSKGAYASNFL